MTRSIPAFDWIAHHADLSPDKTALIDEGRDLTLSYADLDDQSRRLAAWLARNGVGAGDRVAFLAGNTTDVFEALFACAKLGAILVPLNWRLAVPELQFIVDDCRPQVLIFQEPFAEQAAALDVPVTLQLGDDYAGAKAASSPTLIGAVTATFDDP
ncbi:MAG: AMP-binding protein, partial [Acidimicrobiia bacterium]|nr:AMP-binding protein [Acidimicrobiia bacterium]MDX2466028.1 AMP-binding protein [Acidimicrobiia bacterium]